MGIICIYINIDALLYKVEELEHSINNAETEKVKSAARLDKLREVGNLMFSELFSQLKYGGAICCR